MKKTLLMFAIVLGSATLVSAQTADGKKTNQTKQTAAAKQQAVHARQLELKKAAAKKSAPATDRITKAPEAVAPLANKK